MMERGISLAAKARPCKRRIMFLASAAALKSRLSASRTARQVSVSSSNDDDSVGVIDESMP